MRLFLDWSQFVATFKVGYMRLKVRVLKDKNLRRFKRKKHVSPSMGADLSFAEPGENKDF